DAISASSVLTTTKSTLRDASAARMVCATSGSPARSRTFLRGTPLEPPRAGMIATQELIVSRSAVELAPLELAALRQLDLEQVGRLVRQRARDRAAIAHELPK